jgi:uncharacterized protein YqkB
MSGIKTNFICALCQQTYEKKEFERDGKDLCSKRCNKSYFEDQVKPQYEQKEKELAERAILRYGSLNGASGSC